MTAKESLDSFEHGRRSAESERDEWRARAQTAEARLRLVHEQLADGFRALARIPGYPRLRKEEKAGTASLAVNIEHLAADLKRLRSRVVGAIRSVPLGYRPHHIPVEPQTVDDRGHVDSASGRGA